ncbi:AraC family transcriptional regulator [Saccharospirillum sp. MSK14-1]|uniref:AraC family transcriptional regulator n=1 Tax=Saccharospirillum sp. MSK14-1 TaxID=1897632 RepID=UPI000D398458|nr:AraC family transcriptional regulator [Saccharospirillum sp. MSK14-1]PTY37627.1 AraC family transcriptional regulator [Saccharospirillum sp. MSK14-1]
MTAQSPQFWRDDRLPQLELRRVEDGRTVCYAPHSHQQWSLGAITDGHSTFLYRDNRYPIQAGTLVLMNPGWVHACNPVDNQPWAYWMLYVDTDWLTELRHQAGLLPTPVWQDIATPMLNEPRWYDGYCALAQCLIDPQRDLLEKQSQAVLYLTELMQHLAQQPLLQPTLVPDQLRQLADYLDEHAASDLSLDELCALSGYSAGYLIRAFKQHFGLTPHAYVVNRRIQLGQQALKAGTPIAEAALDTGFSDQAHFQRTFKKLVAATPNQYRRSVEN